MASSEVNSLSNQAEKILDEHTSRNRDRTIPGPIVAPIEVAAVLAELAKAHAMVELADAIRESFNVNINRP